MHSTDTPRAYTSLGFIGGGQMASALAKGAIASGFSLPSALHFAEPNPLQATKLRSSFPDCLIGDSQQVFAACSMVVLALKPQVLSGEFDRLRSLIRRDHFLVSIVAGISLRELCDRLGTERIARVMPNTPCQVGMGASGITIGNGVEPQETRQVEMLLKGVGTVVSVSDDQLHAVTGLSGSGPAYVFAFIEAMADGGVAAGLPREVALQLAIQTVQGAAKLCADSQIHPAQLKDQVASPAGTTIEGLRMLEKGRLRSSVIEAVVAASRRSRELGGASHDGK